jgi:serine phosphatase RsbU (regulator of sigma subunit)
LADLGSKLNDIIHRDGLRNSFASLLYVEIEPDSGEVRLLNAGHLPPVVLRETSREEMPRGAPALGILSDASYEERTLELQPGDLLLVYSDGLTEAMNDRGDFFGEKRLAVLLTRLRVLSAETAGTLLLAEVDRFIGDEAPSDDLSLALLKRAPKT